MNTKELNEMLSTLLADSSENFYTKSERLVALNSACSYMNSELRILRDVEVVTVTPLDSGIPLPTDFVALGKGLLWQDVRGTTTNLQLRTPVQLQESNAGWGSEKGIPSSYVLEGSNIYLTPQPTEAGQVVMSFIRMPNTLLNDDDIPFYGDPRIQAYHDIIVYKAAWQLTLKDRDFEAAQQFWAYFQSRMIDLKENLRHTGGVGMQPVWGDSYNQS